MLITITRNNLGQFFERLAYFHSSSTSSVDLANKSNHFHATDVFSLKISQMYSHIFRRKQVKCCFLIYKGATRNGTKKSKKKNTCNNRKRLFCNPSSHQFITHVSKRSSLIDPHSSKTTNCNSGSNFIL